MKTLLMLVISLCSFGAFADIPVRIENNTTNWLYVTWDESDRGARYYVQPGLPLELPWPSTSIFIFSGYGSGAMTLEEKAQTLYVSCDASGADDFSYGIYLQTITHDDPSTVFWRGGSAALGFGATGLLIRRFRSSVKTVASI
jgi:hypothetical protein